MNFLTVNLAIITDKWPDIAQLLCSAHYDINQVELVEDNERSLVFDNIQLASSYNQQAEANFQMKNITADSSNITVYGISLGVLQAQLLKRKNLKCLNVIILNISVFKASLRYFNHKEWLFDPRVNLVFPSPNQPVFFPFIALPAELVLASNESAKLRDRVCLTLDHSFINKNSGHENLKLQNEINKNLDYLKQDKSVSALILASKSINYIVCGAGPTLEDSFTWLKGTLKKGKVTLVAVDAAVKPLAEIGVIPDIIVSIDPVAKRLLKDLNFEQYQNVPLIYFPIVDNAFLASWPGTRYAAYSTGELYDTINKKYPKQRLYCGGSVIHPAIDLSVKMGAEKILLLGADFSFPKGKTHTFWDSSEFDLLSVTKTSHWVLNSCGERVPTLLNYRGYLRDLEQYIEITKGVEFFNGSKKGALIEGTKQWINSHDF